MNKLYRLSKTQQATKHVESQNIPVKPKDYTNGVDLNQKTIVHGQKKIIRFTCVIRTRSGEQIHTNFSFSFTILPKKKKKPFSIINNYMNKTNKELKH